MRKAIFAAFLLLLGSAVLGATVFREQVADAAANLNVFVTNDSANPVPVRQQGTATVTVANTSLPVHEQGTAAVAEQNIDSATGGIKVREQGIVTVRDANNPAPQPYERNGDFGFSNGFSTARSEDICVPNGKRLVIQYFSAVVTLPSGQTLPRFQLRGGPAGFDATVFVFIPLTFAGTLSGIDHYVASEQILAHIDGCFYVHGVRSATNENGFTSFFVGGYLLDTGP